MFMRVPKHGKCTYTPVSVHLSNTTAKRRVIAKMFFGQLREVAEKNNADINAGDFNASAHHERGKAKLSSIEEATATLVPNVEAWAAAVSLGAQGTLVMPEEVFLAASTSASAGQ